MMNTASNRAMYERMDAPTIAALLDMGHIADNGGHFELTRFGLRAVEADIGHFALDNRKTAKLYRQLLAIRERAKRG